MNVSGPFTAALAAGLIGVLISAPALAQQESASDAENSEQAVKTPADLDGPDSELVGDYPAKLELGDKVPEFVYRDIEGNTGRFSDFTGDKKILLNFWATWCGWCKKELSALQLYHEQFSGENEFEIVTIATDEENVAEKVNKLKKKENLGFPLLADPDHSVFDYFTTLPGRKVWPTNFLINEQGRVVKKHTGTLDGWGAVEEFITKPAESESSA